MKQLAYIVILLIGLMACGEREEYRDALQRAEAAMGDHPDSALQILDSLGEHEQEFGKHFRMQYLLHRTNAQNKTNIIFTSDSVAKELVDHFDSHGTTNERVLAHYLLGRAYSDMGEAPKAINSFQDAINAADTTAKDFDFYTLGCVYSQMATVYHRQQRWSVPTPGIIMPTPSASATRAVSMRRDVPTTPGHQPRSSLSTRCLSR